MADGKKRQIEIFYLPPCSPEFNPDECFNCDLKAGVHSGKPARTKEQLKKKVIGHMRMLQRRSALVTKYLKHEKIRHAA